MRRLLSVILIFTILLSLVSCGESDDYDSESYVDDYEEEYEYEDEEENEKDEYTEEERELDDNSISWSEAKNHVGEYTTVSGMVMDTSYSSESNGQPTFLDLGVAYPDPERVTIIIWGDNRSAFSYAPEEYYSNKYIYVTGEITTYNGILQIEAYSENDIIVAE